MRWQLDRSKKVPLTQQLVEQIRYAIATGQLKPGDRLPTGRELANELGVHYNTVFAALHILAEEGLVKMKQGSGIYVAEFSQDQLKQATLASLEPALETLLRSVQLGLVTKEDLLRLVTERLEALEKPTVTPKVAFVECNAEQVETCCRQLTEALGVEVQPVLLDDAQKDPKQLRSFDLIVTTFFHLRAVKALATKKQTVVPTLSVPSRRFLESIAQLPTDARLGVICRDKVSLPTIVQQVQQLTGIEPKFSAWLKDRRGFWKVLRESDVIIYMPPCRNRVLALAPKGKTLIEFEHEIDDASLEQVKRVFERMKMAAQKS